MIVYESDKAAFFDEVRRNTIATTIKNNFITKGISGGGSSEINSWINSLNHMKNILDTDQIANDTHIAIEYSIPFSTKRIDFMICGHSQTNQKNVVILELKQWQKIKIGTKSDFVITFTGGAEREVLHPSYQVKSYQYLLESFNSAIDLKKIKCTSFAYLHNADKKNNSDLINFRLFAYAKNYPIYFQSDYDDLQNELINLVGKGKGKDILYDIENGKLKPSKKLIDVVGDSLKNNSAFMLIETQKQVYENIISKVNEKNNVFIINGNPGTGKSVVAINLLKQLLSFDKIVQYVAPNASFKNSIKNALKTHAKNNKYKDGLDTLFKGAIKFCEFKPKSIDWVIVDEAHRLKNKENLYKGKNQIDDIIKASQNVVFFVDEQQQIRTNDIGSNKNIVISALKNNMRIHSGDQYKLETQFRCVGAQGYINAIDNVLQIKETANFYLNEDNKYDIRICDTPQIMEQLLNQRISEGYTNSRILSGYAWEWISKKCKKQEEIYEIANHDIVIDEHNWSIPWNYNHTDMLWSKKSINKREAGCVHVAQGLEFDYCGIIIGNDLTIDNNNNIKAIYKNYYDKAGKTNYRGEGTLKLSEDNAELTRLVKNIYKILLTRGQKGSYVFIRDEKLRAYFKKHILS